MKFKLIWINESKTIYKYNITIYIYFRHGLKWTLPSVCTRKRKCFCVPPLHFYMWEGFGPLLLWNLSKKRKEKSISVSLCKCASLSVHAFVCIYEYEHTWNVFVTCCPHQGMWGGFCGRWAQSRLLMAALQLLPDPHDLVSASCLWRAEERWWKWTELLRG